jgi:hypothetical protein
VESSCGSLISPIKHSCHLCKRPPSIIADAPEAFLFKTVPESGWIWGLKAREGTGIPMPLISYDLPSKRHVIDFCNYAGCYGVMPAPGPQGDRITFEGDVTIFNISIHMRQTLTKLQY